MNCRLVFTRTVVFNNIVQTSKSNSFIVSLKCFVILFYIFAVTSSCKHKLQIKIMITQLISEPPYNCIPYRTKLWRGENFGEFGESPQFTKFFSPTFPMKHENAGKPWIRQSFFRQCFKITISPNFFIAKVLFYTVYYFMYIASKGIVYS